MKTLLKTLLLHAAILCAMLTSGVHIESEPAADGNLIETELNTTVSLICRQGTANGIDMQLVWLRNGAMVKLEPNNMGDNSSVCVTPVTHGDNGAIFTCQWRDNTTFKASVALNVTYGPSINGSEDVILEEQEAMVLQCDMRANPAVSVVWRFNETILDQAVSQLIVTNDGFTTRLTAAKVVRDLHEGTYTCETRSTRYGTHTETFRVTINERRPRFPLMPMVAGIVVVSLTILLAIFSRRQKIAKCCK